MHFLQNTSGAANGGHRGPGPSPKRPPKKQRGARWHVLWIGHCRRKDDFLLSTVVFVRPDSGCRLQAAAAGHSWRYQGSCGSLQVRPGSRERHQGREFDRWKLKWTAVTMTDRPATAARDCNPGIPESRDPGNFPIPKSRDWAALNPGISG